MNKDLTLISVRDSLCELWLFLGYLVEYPQEATQATDTEFE